MRLAGSALIVVLAALSAGHAAQDVAVQAGVDADRIGENDSLNFTIEVRGGSLPAVEEPDLSALRDFSVASGPNQSTSTSMVWSGGGANVTTVKKYGYVLLPRRRGTLTIPSFAVVVAGTPYRTREIAVEVAQGSARSQSPPGPFQPGPFSPRGARRDRPPAGDVFVEATLDKKEAYAGEQVLLTYKLYTQMELAALPQPRQLAAYTGFWVEEMPVDPRATIRRTVQRGKEYLEITLMKKALFPTRSGVLPIEETTFEILVRAGTDDPFGAFLNPARPLYRRTPALTLTVRPLPEAGRPASFQGAVGRFTLAVAADRSEAQVNDAIGLTVKVQGDGNVRTIGEPLLPDLPDYKRYEPKVEEERQVAGDRIRGTRSWAYVLVPLAAGDRTIPPVRFAYFDPAAGAYKEVTGGPLSVKVGRGGTPQGEATASVRREVVAVGRDIRFIKPASSLGARGGLRGSAWFYLLLAVPVAGNAALYAHLRRREHLAANAGLFRGRRARSAARRRLKQARGLMAPGREEAFFAEMDRAVTGYLADKFDLSALGLTRDRIGELLARRGVPEDLSRRAIACLERCDLGRFAARSAAREQTAALLEQGEDVIASLERFLG